jgi:hypothetical protein
MGMPRADLDCARFKPSPSRSADLEKRMQSRDMVGLHVLSDATDQMPLDTAR